MLAKQIYCILVQYCILIAVQYCGCKRAHWDNRVGGRRAKKFTVATASASLSPSRSLSNNRLCLRRCRRSGVARNGRRAPHGLVCSSSLSSVFYGAGAARTLSLSPPRGRWLAAESRARLRLERERALHLPLLVFSIALLTHACFEARATLAAKIT